MTDDTLNNRDRLIFALDVPEVADAKQLATELGDAVTFYKIGLELMMSGDYFELLDWLLEREKKVFCDLKLHDIPATVGRSVKRLSERGATYVTVHGYPSVMAAAAENKGDTLKILAVTVLTSMDRGDLDELGAGRSVEELVIHRAHGAYAAGCDGVIASGLELPAIREYCNPSLRVITPGIRPDGDAGGSDQKRVVTVEQAITDGATHIVVGRPIRDAENPRQAAEQIQGSIARAVDIA